MDKYTVDLDQVLNDFEYSELTDHYTNDLLNKSQSAEQQSANNQNHIVKHSINNVFHSLNEYLNTDITPKANDDTSQSVNESNGVSESPAIYIEDTNNYTKLNEDPVTTTTTADNQNSNDVNCAPPAAEYSEPLSNVSETSEDFVQSSTSSKRDLDTPESERKLIDNSFEEDATSCDIADKSSDSAEIKADNSDSALAGDSQTDDANMILEHRDDDFETKLNDEIFLLEDNEIPDMTLDEIPEIVEESFVINEEQVDNIVVGFDETFDLDEGELNELLEKLEDEFKNEEIVQDYPNNMEELSKIVEDNVQSISLSLQQQMSEQPSTSFADYQDANAVEATSSNPVIKEETTEEVNEEENIPRPTELALTETNAEAKKIDLIGDPGSTPYNNVYKDIPKQTYECDSEECSTSVSPTSSEATSGSLSTCSTDDVQEVEKLKELEKALEAVATAMATEEPPSTEPEVEEGAAAAAPAAAEVEEVVEASSAEPVAAQEEPAAVAIIDGEEIRLSDIDLYLGKRAPHWMPDNEADNCLYCDMKFTVIKRRHHCRACGKVLCSKCCSLKHKLSYLNAEARVCTKCIGVLKYLDDTDESNSEASPAHGPPSSPKQPNPNNPSEYCSTVSPLDQVAGGSASPPAVMVPVGVLKRKGSNKGKSNKTVMFCDGIRPGSDLTNLDSDFNYNSTKTSVKKAEKAAAAGAKSNKIFPPIDGITKSFLPADDNCLPPTVSAYKTDVTYTECVNSASVVEALKTEQMSFALNANLLVHVKIVNLDCCVNKVVWCFSTEGLINVGQDEVLYLLELIEDEALVPKDMFNHINNIYLDAAKAVSVKESGISLHNASNFLDSKNHAGFVYIRPTFQCLQNVIIPKDPYIIGILIHRWETPWAKLFPLRLILRLGALYRYYPSPVISTRHRESVFVEIGHTIINLLADFRNYSYTIPQIRGLTIHMEDKITTINIPTNGYDQVMKSVNHSTDHILAFAGNFSQLADSHLVCIQDTSDNDNAYTTHAINIHNKPRKITGASFIVFNGALKSSSGLSAKWNIVEDGLMVQVLPENLVEIRESLRSMKNYTIQCGAVNAAPEETVNIVWGENDTNFNLEVVSPIDNTTMQGVPSIRVHNGKDYVCNSGNRLIRWTEVFIIQNSEDSPKNHDPVDISKVSESISKATCNALVKYLDLLVSNNFFKIAIRTTLHVENVSYSAGSNGLKLPPIYMKSLDNELIPVLHRITSNNFGENAVILELVFRILNTT